MQWAVPQAVQLSVLQVVTLLEKSLMKQDITSLGNRKLVSALVPPVTAKLFQADTEHPHRNLYCNKQHVETRI